MDRQAAFEQLIVAQLNKIQSYIEDFIVLTPAPFQAQISSTPMSTGAQYNECFNFPEVPLTKAVPVLSPSVPSPLSTAQATDNHSSSSSNHKGGLEPSTLSYLRANSCSRENFASKLVKELFTAEEGMVCNVKGVMGKKKLDEQKMKYIRAVTFENYPCGVNEQKAAWSKCVKAIDSASRALCRLSTNTEKENKMPA